jgi:hypothetical protein
MRNLLTALILTFFFVCAVRGTGEPQVSTITNTPTYAAAINVTNTGNGDVMCIYGSATRTVFVTQVHMTGIASTAITIVEGLVKRSSVESGGTPVAMTAVPFNSSNPAATAVATAYSVSPTPGTSIGPIDNHFIGLGNSTNTASLNEFEANYGNLSDQPVTLHGTSEGLCVNIGAGGTGASYGIHVRWMES